MIYHSIQLDEYMRVLILRGKQKKLKHICIQSCSPFSMVRTINLNKNDIVSKIILGQKNSPGSQKAIACQCKASKQKSTAS